MAVPSSHQQVAGLYQMQKEVLLALAGHAGDIIVEVDGGFRVVGEIKFLSLAEREVLNELAKLSYQARRLLLFTQTMHDALTNPGGGGDAALGGGDVEDDPDDTDDDDNDDDASSTRRSKRSHHWSSSTYRQALATALAGVMDTYQLKLVELEAIAMSDSALPLSYIRCELRDYELLFPKLISIIDETAGLKGAKILNCLYAHLSTGVGIVQECVRHLLWCCHQVLYNQMISWIVYGTLVDWNQEFFIKATQTATTRSLFIDSSTLESKGVDVISAEYQWNTEFVINMDMLPTRYFPLRLAQKILAIGRACHLLSNPARFGQAAAASMMLLPETVVAEFSTILKALSQQRVFHLLTVDCVIDRIKTVVDEHLWKLLIHSAALPAHLHALKDYMLLGRGEFFHMFIEESHRLMDMPFKDHQSLRDLQDGPFVSAAQTSNALKDPLFNNCRLFFHSKSFTWNPQAPGGSFQTLGSARLQGDQLLLSAHGQADKAGGLLSSEAAKAAGALWFRNRMAVADGWATEFEVVVPTTAGSAAPASGSRTCSFAFVLQSMSDRALGAARIAASRAVSGQEVRHAGFDGIHDSIAVVFDLVCSADTGAFNKVAVRVFGGDRVKQVPTSQDNACLIGTGVLACPAPGRPLIVTLRYTRSAGLDGSVRSQLDISEGKQDACVLALRLKLTLADHMTFVGADQRCWVGFTAPPVDGSNALVALRSWNFSVDNHVDEGWRGLSLDYQVPWPLYLVVSQASMAVYIDMFRFTFYLKRVTLALQRSWGQLMQFKAPKYQKLLHRLWLLRAEMSAVVTSLETYLHTDVIEAAFSTLHRAVEESRNFEAVVAAHDTFMSHITNLSYLRQKLRRNAIFDVLEVCLTFCRAIDTVDAVYASASASASGVDEATRDEARFAAMEKEWGSKVRYMFSLLRTRADSGGSLLLRMDYNQFFRRKEMMPDVVDVPQPARPIAPQPAPVLPRGPSAGAAVATPSVLPPSGLRAGGLVGARASSIVRRVPADGSTATASPSVTPSPSTTPRLGMGVPALPPPSPHGFSDEPARR